MSVRPLLLSLLLVFSTQTLWANQFKTERWETKNGVRVVFYQAMEVPMLDLSLAFAAGSAYDGEHFGLSALTTNLMDQGNAGLDATAIADSLADVGAQFNAETSRNMAVFSLRTLTNKEALDPAKITFNKIINHPDFPDAAFAREKQQLLMAIKQDQESPDDVANLKFFNALYKDHPYGHPVNGLSDTVSALTKEQVKTFYQQYFVAKNALLIIVGAVDSPTAHQIAEQVTQELKPGKRAAPIPMAKPLDAGQSIQVKFPSSQTIVRLGQLGIAPKNPLYFPLLVGNYILGGGSLTSRLAIEVREKQGLTYGIDSQFSPMPGRGPFLISLSTKGDEAQKAIKLSEEILQQFIKEGPKQEELEAAKLYLTGSFPLSLASNSSIAALLLRMTFYELPEDYLDTYIAHINEITLDQIQKAFNENVTPQTLLLVTVGQS